MAAASAKLAMRVRRIVGLETPPHKRAWSGANGDGVKACQSRTRRSQWYERV